MQSQKRSQVRQELTQSLRHVIPLTLHVLEQKSNVPSGGDVVVQVTEKARRNLQSWKRISLLSEVKWKT